MSKKSCILSSDEPSFAISQKNNAETLFTLFMDTYTFHNRNYMIEIFLTEAAEMV